MPNDPAHPISDAATGMIEAADATAFAVTVQSRSAEYEARGVVDLGAGIYRVSARASRAPVLMAFDRPARDGVSIRAVGLNGRTGGAMLEHVELVEGERQVCWVSPHLPIGTWGGAISVEDAVILLGELIEDLRYVDSDAFPGMEIEPVSTAGTAARYRVPGALLGVVPPGATVEPDVWDGRNLVSRVTAPVRVSVGGDGRITRLGLTLRYRPVQPEGLPRPGPQLPPERVTVEVTLSVADEALRLVQPECVGTE